MFASFKEYITKNIAQESERVYLWLPLFMICGILSYFIFSNTLFALCAFIPTIILFALYFKFRRFTILAASFFLLGLFAMGFRVHSLNTPTIPHDIRDEKISARVLEVERRPNNMHLLLNEVLVLDAKSENAKTLNGIGKIRVTLNFGQKEYPNVGDSIIANVMLFAPTAQMAPSSVNLYENLFFKGIAASGYVKSLMQIERVDSGSESARDVVSRNIRRNLPRNAAAVATALITGENTVRNVLQDAYRGSGIIHLLSISGAHMTLIAALIFLLIRSLLSFIPTISLKHDSKKIAAIITLFVSAFYLHLSGGAIPAVRAFMITALVLAGIIFSRPVFNVRSLAVVAIAMLMARPENVFSASFQMSFLAVFLVMEIYRRLPALVRNMENPLLKNICISMLVSIGASVVIMPTLLYYFNKFSLLSFITNIIAEPVFSLLIMPALALSVFLMGFSGVFIYPLKIAGFGIEILNNIALKTAEVPFMQMEMKIISTASFVIMLFGVLWYLIWSAKWRRWGIVILAFGFILGVSQDLTPDVIISPNHDSIGFKTRDAKLYVKQARRDTFIKSVWGQKYGLTDDISLVDANLVCTVNECSYEKHGQKLLWDLSSAKARCDVYNLVVNKSGLNCGAPAASKNNIPGAVLLWFKKDGIKVQELNSAFLK